MNTTSPQTGYFYADECNLDAFQELIGQTLDPASVPNACDIQNSVPIYDMPSLAATLADDEKRNVLMAEFADVLMHTAGVLVLRGAYADTTVLDQATSLYETIIQHEKQTSGGGADHFAAAGTNDRIWNSLQKLCEASPDVFLRYFANTAIATVCQAWLGPNYQMTAQINLVHPGGAAQQAHRDYHLGFQTEDISARYPRPRPRPVARPHSSRCCRSL